jgi:hypothetical protein
VTFELIKPDGKAAKASFSLVLQSVSESAAPAITVHSENYTPHVKLTPGEYEVFYSSSNFRINEKSELRFISEERSPLSVARASKNNRIRISPGEQTTQLFLPERYSEHEIRVTNTNAKSKSGYGGYLSIKRAVKGSSTYLPYDQKSIHGLPTGDTTVFTAANDQWFEISLTSANSNKNVKRIIRGGEPKQLEISAE